jgi:hypothetical protein
MSSHFDASLSHLCLGEYSEALVSHGFKTWDDLIDISEETMAELGFKLGHRRKLQREIASYRGLPRTQPLVRPPAVDGLQESEEPKSARVGQDELETKEPTSLKRRYRHRQPKDPHAPRKPGSDYVLFGKFLRQDPDVSKLPFVDISKLVGERWQRLSPEERAAWTSTAAQQKRRYRMELAEYQQSEDYRDHQDRLRMTKLEKSTPSNEVSPTGSPKKTVSTGSGHMHKTVRWTSTVSSRHNLKDSSITMAASEDGGHDASFGRRFSISVSHPEREFYARTSPVIRDRSNIQGKTAELTFSVLAIFQAPRFQLDLCYSNSRAADKESIYFFERRIH